MKRIILYPTHRKFIKLLKCKTKYGKYVVLKKDDMVEITNILCDKNLNSVGRHQKIYKSFLRIVMNNSYNKECVLLEIKKIREYICQRERRTLLRTIRNTFFYYIFKFLSRLIRKS